MAGLALRVPDWLRQRAAVTPERRALVCGAQAWSFAELDRRVDAAAASLDVREGERVGIRAANSLGFVVAVQALMRRGGVLVPINTRLTDAEVAWQVEDAQVSRVVGDDDLEALLRQPTPAHQTRARDFELHAWHSIVYTSGTTGRPKGAILTYGNHWWSAVASALNLGLLADDTWLACLPLFHVGGLAILLRGVIYGMAVVVQSRFEAAEVNRAIDEQGVTIVSVVSTMLERMLAERGPRAYPPSLRCVLLGGGPAPLPLLERAAAAGVPVVQTYGLTETASQVVTLAPEDALRKLGSAGKPLMGSEIRVGSDGEIEVRGPSVSPGYVNHPPRDGWLHTGDLGRLDDDGYLYVLDRRDDLIVSGGENVYPAEVEAALLAHPAVSEAGVIGVPDAEWGRRVTAVVVVRAGVTATADELIAFCRQRLAAYKAPRHIEFRSALPRNGAGKLLRRELRIER
ncbi:MAG: o-succinylbenzoate--CoA ligase [Chloroflexi bacterium]|nr:o-succinylbenzoate--CoA ligase [Chloroflexota bacterium]